MDIQNKQDWPFRINWMLKYRELRDFVLIILKSYHLWCRDILSIACFKYCLACRGVYDLHMAYSGTTESTKVPPVAASSWLPIDPTIRLPYHIKRSRVPCTFEPKGSLSFIFGSSYINIYYSLLKTARQNWTFLF